MSRELAEISGDREALGWALGCLQTSCRERLKSTQLTGWRPVRWGMALWMAVLALEMFAFSAVGLDYKLGLGIFRIYPYPRKVPLWEVTPLWEPILASGMGVALLLAIVPILKRSRIAFGATVAPLAIMPLLLTGRFRLAELDIQRNLLPIYQQHPFEVIWPIAGVAITVLICVALWQDRRRPAPH